MDNRFVTDRRNALKILGFSSAALFTGVFGNIPEATAAEMVKTRKPAIPTGRSNVVFATGTDRRAMMAEVMKPYEKQIREGIKGKQLIIKPNMVSTTVPLCATHVDALRGVLEFIKPMYSGQIIIAEATAGKGVSMPGFTTYGYTELQKDFDLKFIDLNTATGSPIWVLNKDLYPDKIQITDMFVNPNNYIISVSRLKSHNTVVMTAGTKNMVMAAPLNIPEADGKPQVNYKRSMHSGGPRWLHYNMFLVARQVRPNLAIIDGVEGMEGNGPVNGTPVDHRIALAGEDVLAVDSICAKLMGIPLENVGYLNFAAADGLGIVDREKIDIIGGKDPDQFVKTYKLSENIATQMQWKEPLFPPK
jgi:uncharacterized protein (DUF362 family)